MPNRTLSPDELRNANELLEYWIAWTHNSGTRKTTRDYSAPNATPGFRLKAGTSEPRKPLAQRRHGTWQLPSAERGRDRLARACRCRFRTDVLRRASLGPFVECLSKGRVPGEYMCNLDPDLRADALARSPDWAPRGGTSRTRRWCTDSSGGSRCPRRYASGRIRNTPSPSIRGYARSVSADVRPAAGRREFGDAGLPRVWGVRPREAGPVSNTRQHLYEPKPPFGLRRREDTPAWLHPRPEQARKDLGGRNARIADRSATSSARATGRDSRRAAVRARATRPRRRWNTLHPALVGQRVSARPRQLAVGEGLLAGLGERGGAETEFAAPAADDEPLDPASVAGRLDEEVQKSCT